MCTHTINLPRERLAAILGNARQKYAYIVEADESTRQRLERPPHKNHEDRIAGKVIIESLQSETQIYSCASNNENTRCKRSCKKREGKTQENTGMEPDESQKH